MNRAGPTSSGSGCVSCCSCGRSCLLQPSPGPLEASQGLTCDPRSYSLGLSSRPIQWGIWSQGPVMLLPVLSFPDSRCLQGPTGLNRVLLPEGAALVSTPFTAPGQIAEGWAANPAIGACVRSMKVTQHLSAAGRPWKSCFSTGAAGGASGSQLLPAGGAWGRGLGGWWRLEGLNATEPTPTAAAPSIREQTPSSPDRACTGVPGCRSPELESPTRVSQKGAKPRPQPRPG